MEQWIVSGNAVDWILLVVAIEATALVLYASNRSRTIGTLSITSNLAAGAFLLLALRAALTQASPIYIALALLAAGVAHAADVYLRLRSTQPRKAN